MSLKNLCLLASPLALLMCCCVSVSAQELTPSAVPPVQSEEKAETSNPPAQEPVKEEVKEEVPVETPPVESPSDQQPATTSNANPWAGAFDNVDFSAKLKQRVAEQLAPVQADVDALRGEVQAVRSDVAQMKEQLPGQIADQVRKITPGIVTSELAQQTPGLIEPIVNAKVDAAKVPFGEHAADQSVEAVVEMLTEEGLLKKKTAVADNSDSGAAPPSAETAAPPKTQTAGTQTQQPVQYDGTGSYQRHNAEGKLAQAYRPVTGFEPCPHCGAKDGYLCSPSGPVKSSTMTAANRSNGAQQQHTRTVAAPPATTQQSAPTTDYVLPGQEPQFCAPGMPCYKGGQTQEHSQCQPGMPCYNGGNTYSQPRRGLLRGFFGN